MGSPSPINPDYQVSETSGHPPIESDHQPLQFPAVDTCSLPQLNLSTNQQSGVKRFNPPRPVNKGQPEATLQRQDPSKTRPPPPARGANRGNVKDHYVMPKTVIGPMPGSEQFSEHLDTERSGETGISKMPEDKKPKETGQIIQNILNQRLQKPARKPPPPARRKVNQEGVQTSQSSLIVGSVQGTESTVTPKGEEIQRNAKRLEAAAVKTGAQEYQAIATSAQHPITEKQSSLFVLGLKILVSIPLIAICIVGKVACFLTVGLVSYGVTAFIGFITGLFIPEVGHKKYLEVCADCTNWLSCTVSFLSGSLLSGFFLEKLWGNNFFEKNIEADVISGRVAGTIASLVGTYVSMLGIPLSSLVFIGLYIAKWLDRSNKPQSSGGGMASVNIAGDCAVAGAITCNNLSNLGFF